jgi:hypothetical protein
MAGWQESKLGVGSATYGPAECSVGYHCVILFVEKFSCVGCNCVEIEN